MRNRLECLVTMIVLVIWACSFAGHSSAGGFQVQLSPGELTPHSTVILANKVDARFSRDFSTLLRHLVLLQERWWEIASWMSKRTLHCLVVSACAKAASAGAFV